MIVFETERTVVRWMNYDDAQFVIDMLNSSGWLNNIGDRNVRTISDAKTYLKNKVVSDYEGSGFGMYVIMNKESNTYIGMTGLVDRPGLEGIDMGFALLTDQMGKGYAFEASQPLIAHAQQHKIKLLKAITLPSNQPSRNLLEKLGFNLIKEFYMESDPELLCLYEMDLA